jgi:DNA helicase-2/ATP-dependent DNA helicase PcrA
MNWAEEFARLNDEQKAAVRSDDNLVVLAGPGSGKTATLVVKIARLLEERISPPAGLACVTYNNEAVTEFRRRLSLLGVGASRRVFLGTVHSFCLNCVLRPYGPLVDARFQNGIQVANAEQQRSLFSTAVETVTPGSDPTWAGPPVTRCRRARACGEDLTPFGTIDPAIAVEYERLLLEANLIDFEGMVVLALEFFRSHAWIRDLVAARFPWLLIDEYQDLGGPLHRIVTTLADAGSQKIFAVGDPDQTIYDFTGADPKYLRELGERNDFDEIPLRLNYRSGQRLIDASQAALAPDVPRDYVCAPEREDPGEIFFYETNGTSAAHAAQMVTAIRRAADAGEPLHEIAVLYRAAGHLLDALRAGLEAEGIPFIWERDTRYPSSPLIRWMQNAAAWSLASPADRPPFAPLVREYLAWMNASEDEQVDSSLARRGALYAFLSEAPADGLLLRDWIPLVDEALGFTSRLARPEMAYDAGDFASLRAAADEGALRETPLADFAAPGQVKGKAILTTLHSSKGRQFGAVIIPGCAEGNLPAWRWNPRLRRWDAPNPYLLAEGRRLFYVGITRAKRSVHLIHSGCFENARGLVRLGESRFIAEIRRRLGEA